MQNLDEADLKGSFWQEKIYLVAELQLTYIFWGTLLREKSRVNTVSAETSVVHLDPPNHCTTAGNLGNPSRYWPS